MTISRRFVLGGLATLAMPAIVHAKMWPIVDGPSVSNGEVDESTKKWFEDATSKRNGPCCSTADGFRRGYTYRVRELVGNQVEDVDRLMFRSIKPHAEGYMMTVYDVVTHRYVDLMATTPERVQQPNNPTGSDIVWLRHAGFGNQISIRCFCLANEV